MISRSLHALAATTALALLLLPGCARLKPRPAAGPPHVQELVRSSRSWDGAPLPAYPQTQPEIRILRIRIPAGTRLETHHHPVINAGVLLSGELTVVTTAGKTLHLKAGDPIVEVVNTPHYGISSGTEPAEIIVFYAGTEGSPITVSDTP